MKKFYTRITLLLFSLILGVSSFAFAAEKDDAMAMVKSAVAYYKANGMEKTLESLNDSKGQFIKGSLYVFAYDLNGTMMSNVVKPDLVGQNVIDVPDVTGKIYRREIIEIAVKTGSGWVDYKTMHPKTKSIEQKTTYFEKIEDLVIGCGIYK